MSRDPVNERILTEEVRGIPASVLLRASVEVRCGA